MTLEECPYDKLNSIYGKLFSTSGLAISFEKKIALITAICTVTSKINAKKDDLEKITCHDVILKLGSELPDYVKNTFFKSLGAICDDLMKNCDDFPNFGIPVKEYPKFIKDMLWQYLPF